jgi:hypothetical protein
MSARKDHDKLLKDLRREGWTVTERGNTASAEHKLGGRVDIPCHHQGIHNAKFKVRQIEAQHEEENRRKIRAQNDGKKVPATKVLNSVELTFCSGPPPVRAQMERLIKRRDEPMTPLPTNDDPRKKDESNALLELLTEFDSKLGAIGLGLSAVTRKIDQLLARLQEEADRKADAESYARRLKLLDDELGRLDVDGTRLITFDSEIEQVAHLRVLHAYGRDRGKEFRATKEDLKTFIWRVK